MFGRLQCQQMRYNMQIKNKIYNTIHIFQLVMLTTNPFTQNTRYPFTSSLHYTSSTPYNYASISSTSSLYSSTYQRHYFPKTQIKNTQKPGFLMTSMVTLPTFSGDMRSPYSSLKSGVREEGERLRVRERGRDYQCNPFYKARLVQEPEVYIPNTNDYSSIYESKVTPVYTSYSSNIKQSPNKPTNREQQPIFSQHLPKKPSLKQAPQTNPDYASSALTRNQSYRSEIQKLNRISQQPEQEDNPLNYNYPSFNNKQLFKKQSLKSPTQPYHRLNQQIDSNSSGKFGRVDSRDSNSNYPKFGKIQSRDSGYKKSGSLDRQFEKYNVESKIYSKGLQAGSNMKPESQGTQVTNPMQGRYPSTITHNGKLFYMLQTA